MPHADFVHLRVHSAYSLSEGAIRTKELVKLCREQAMPAVAVTDTGNLFGALEFAAAAAESGIQPIIGTLLGLGGAAGQADGAGRSGLRPPSGRGRPDRLLLLAQDEAGYRNLMALSSIAFLGGEPSDPPQVTWPDLDGRTEGLIALTGGPGGPLGRLLAEGQAAAAEQVLLDLARRFPGRLYVELMRHGTEDEDRIEPELIALALRHGLPLVATNDVFFADAGMYEAHDALLCIADGAYVAETDRRRVTPEHRFKSAAEMRALFADLPEAVDNTVVIARRCAVMPRKRKPILPAYPTAAGRTEAEELRAQARAGLERRLAAPGFEPAGDAADPAERAAAYRTRLDFELGVIEGMGFPGYFLIVADFIQWSKAQGIPVGPGRGSGAGSVVAWALTITDLDPLRFGLLFERFLNPERVSMPDFDVDFCQDRRDAVIDYVARKYGHDRVAQIITFGKLQARAVLRDVGRVLQMPYGQVDRLCKLVPNNPANPVTLKQAIEGEPQLQEAIRSDDTVRRLVDVALKLEGLYRHASTHAAGVVIGDRPLAELVPLYRDPRSPMAVTQFNMKYVELAGLVKFDFLGLKTLTVLARAVELLERGGIRIDLAALPLDDDRTFAMLGRGDATGVFQLESTGMRDTLRRLKPTRFEDLIALVALYRPGPMDNIPKYIKVKHGDEPADYPHPRLEGILRETHGIMIYQEQVMQVAQILAGYSLGKADLLRRAMGKKIRSEMEAQKADFVAGAVANDVPEAQAATIFDLVEKFAGYGFNKSHAAAYALVAYQTAWLKANHPVEFFAASMTLDLGNTDKLAIFRQELQRLGIRLLPPDINRSEAEFGVEALPGGASAIRYALGAVKGVGVEAMKVLVAERASRGPFPDLTGFARRLDPRVINRRQLEGLTRAGAFDSLEPSRARVLAGIDLLLREAHAAADDRDSGQASLFGGAAAPAVRAPALPAVPEWDALERLRQEAEAIGFFLSAHPLDERNPARAGAVPSTAIGRRLREGHTRQKLAGIVTARREAQTRTGKRMAFVTLSDPGGQFEVTLFAEVLAVARPLLEPGTALLVTVEVQAMPGQSGDSGWRLTAEAIEPLDAVLARLGTGLRVTLAPDASPEPLRALLAGEGSGKCRITVAVPVDEAHEAEIPLPGGYAMTAQARATLRTLPGIAAVVEV